MTTHTDVEKKREIKFRIYDEAHGMVYEPGFAGVKNSVVNLNDLFKVPPQVHLMQFTGLHDKNGKDIYEGDIVENYQHKRAPIEFFEGEFLACDNEGRLVNPLEVIGNIYEHGNLLATQQSPKRPQNVNDPKQSSS